MVFLSRVLVVAYRPLQRFAAFLPPLAPDEAYTGLSSDLALEVFVWKPGRATPPLLEIRMRGQEPAPDDLLAPSRPLVRSWLPVDDVQRIVNRVFPAGTMLVIGLQAGSPMPDGHEEEEAVMFLTPPPVVVARQGFPA